MQQSFEEVYPFLTGGDILRCCSGFTDMKVLCCFQGNNAVITKLSEVKSLREGGPRIIFNIGLDDEFLGDDGTSS